MRMVTFYNGDYDYDDDMVAVVMMTMTAVNCCQPLQSRKPISAWTSMAGTLEMTTVMMMMMLMMAAILATTTKMMVMVMPLYLPGGKTERKSP